MAVDVSKEISVTPGLRVAHDRWGWLNRGRGGGDDPKKPPGEPPKPAEPAEGPPKFPELSGVITDDVILIELGKLKGEQLRPIATDTFLGKSKDQYNSAWLARELVQNFVDHNKAHQGTLNGVGFSVETLPTGVTRIRMTGEWPFNDPTGVISPHSEKPDGVNTAGGNGIGLKQTAIRLMRDYEVDKFEIEGEGWTVSYGLAKKDQVNQELAEKGTAHQVRHDWLVANLKQTDQKGRSSYVIETKNPALIQALEQFPSLGVSVENPYLQEPDYVSEDGVIKWLPEGESGEMALGRLFVNGQVMNYKTNGLSELDYWRGPEGVTVQLNNIAYRMNIDRPPVNPWDFQQYISKLVSSMPKETLIDQLGRSENLWAGNTGGGYFDKPGCFVVIESLVDRLGSASMDLKPEEIQPLAAAKKYLAIDARLDDGQITSLEAQGYIICPSYFSKIGFERASTKLGSVDLASTIEPDINAFTREDLAEKYGVQVAFEEFDTKTPADFFAAISERLRPVVTKIEAREGRPATLRLEFPNGIVPSELLANPLFNPKNDPQKLLYLMRGIAFHGLQNNLFGKIFFAQGEAVNTFKRDYDSSSKEWVLFSRNNRGDSEVPFLEIDFQGNLAGEFMEAYAKASVPAEGAPPVQVVATEPVTLGGAAPVEVTTAQPPAAAPGGEGAAATVVSPAGAPGEASGTGKTAAGPAPGEQGAPVPTGAAGASEGAARTGEPDAKLLWTDEDERLFQLTIGKNEAEYSPEERAALEKRQAISQRVAAIGIEQPGGERVTAGGIIEREAAMSGAEQQRLAQLEESLPGIAGLVDELEKNVPRQRVEEPAGKSEHEKYLEWRESPDFYGRLGEEADYLTGRTLVDILNDNSQAVIDSVANVAEVDPAQTALTRLKGRLKAVVDRLVPEGDMVDDFEIVVSPTERERAQLGLLKAYVEVSTNMRVNNDLFLYEGTGSKGMNLSQKAIGLNRALAQTSFEEASGTFVHEVAHNVPEAEDHGVEFRHAMQALFTTINRRFRDISQRSVDGNLTDEDRVLLDISNQWERLRAA